jgi:hypothetical protein
MSTLSLTRHIRGLGISPQRRRAKGAAPPAILQDGLVAEWRFDDGAGQQVTDYVGGFHAQLGATASVDSGEPTWSATGVDMVERSQAQNYVDVLSDLNMDDGSNRTVVVASADLTDLGGTNFGYGLSTGPEPPRPRWVTAGCSASTRTGSFQSQLRSVSNSYTPAAWSATVGTSLQQSRTGHFKAT